MSPPDSLDILEHAVNETWIRNCLCVLAVAISFYDYLITSGKEIAYIWRRPKTANAYWFLLNRYIGILVKVVVLVLMSAKLSHDRCKISYMCYEIVASLVHVIVCLLLSMQVIALYGGSRGVCMVLASGLIALLSIIMWTITLKQDLPTPMITTMDQHGCFIGVSRNGVHWLVVPWITLLVYHSILFGSIVAKTWKTRCETRIPLMEIVFRDGIIYYAVIALSILANILTFYLCGPFLRGSLSPMSTSISSTMMARLMFNLLEVKTDTSNIHTDLSENSLSRVELDTIWTSDLGHRHTIISIASSL